ncbi:MAG: organoarsenical effux MFS transporter ArsJ [Nannocystaceae bacterium]
MSTSTQSLRNYVVVTSAYWVFTLSDGAFRMLLLLHLHERGYSPLAIASMFLLYESLGVVTNWVGGSVGSRFGLKRTLGTGLGLQVVTLSALAGLPSEVWILLAAQATSAVAKDLVKMSAKSYVKLVVPDGDYDRLLRWVSVLTGSKNALKGAGFFLGGVLLVALGFRGACAVMAVALVATFGLVLVVLPASAGMAKTKRTLAEVAVQDRRITWLAAARLFLFGARDVWFVLALPIFLRTELRWTHAEVGGFLALWVMGYGAVQGLAPWYLGSRRDDAAEMAVIPRTPVVPGAGQLVSWTGALAVPIVGLSIWFEQWAVSAAVLGVGLALFGVVFAANSALHSFLIVRYASREHVARHLGVYYSANAAGRLIGTLLSGAVFQAAGAGQAGLGACLWTSSGFVGLAWLLSIGVLRAEQRGSARA